LGATGEIPDAQTVRVRRAAARPTLAQLPIAAALVKSKKCGA